MAFCPICGEAIRLGTVCACGWDPSCNYENYLSLVPLEGKKQSVNANRKEYTQKLLDVQKREYEEKLISFQHRMADYENRINSMLENHRQSYEAAIQKLNQNYEDRLEALSQRVQALESMGVSKLEDGDTEELDGVSGTHEASVTSNNTRSYLKFLITRGKTKSDIVKKSPEGEKIDVRVGEEFILGQYWQGESQTDGKTDIRWLVLEKHDGKALLISRYALACLPYNTEYEAVTWENCTIRAWLNADFYYAAFSAEEQAEILTTTVTADVNRKYGTTPGSNTEDRVFLLSIDEAAQYFASDYDRACEPTDYANTNGAFYSDSSQNCWWWLRSPGRDSIRAATVDDGGSVYDGGDYVDYNSVCVRPALWIKLES